MTKRLPAVLGVAFGLAAIVGNTIGAGILRTPGEIATHLPTPTLVLVAWVVGALYAAGGANAVCELATMMPRSGGQYHYSKEALGPYAGFVVGWNDWLGTAGSIAAVALVLAESVAMLRPELAGRQREVAAGLVIAFTAIVWRRVQSTAVLQNVATTVKAIAFIALILVAFGYAFRHGVAPNASVFIPQGGALLGAFVLAMQSIIFSYDGWTGAVYFSEEIRDPGRDIPRATFGALIGVTVIYLLVNIAFMVVVPLSSLAGDALAAGTVAATMFGARGDTTIRLIIVLALPSYLIATLPMASRVLFAMSRDGLAPRWADRVNAGGTPTAALFATATATLLFLLTGTVNAVISVLSFLFVATYALTFISLFVLRHREPDRARPFRARWHPWSTGIVLTGSIAFLIGTVISDPRNGLIAAALVAMTYPVYRIAVR